MCQAPAVRRLFFSLFALLVPAVTLSASACSSDPSMDGSVSDASIDRTRLAKPIVVDAACPIVIDSPPVLDSPHVAIDTPVTYNSNPPSSGPHYPIWAAFQEYTQPVDRRYYVHDLEHGAVVLLYNCNAGTDAGPAPSCEASVAALRAAIAALPNDPLCTGGGPRVRAVLAPDPGLDVPIAVAAWGWTYRATCIDPASLTDFVKAHYGQGTEALCADGQPTF